MRGTAFVAECHDEDVGDDAEHYEGFKDPVLYDLVDKQLDFICGGFVAHEVVWRCDDQPLDLDPIL
jgi:hypothetical protein